MTRSSIIRFRNHARASAYAASTASPHRVMHGDDGRYWIVTPADAARLEAAGYEYAPVCAAIANSSSTPASAKAGAAGFHSAHGTGPA